MTVRGKPRDFWRPGVEQAAYASAMTSVCIYWFTPILRLCAPLYEARSLSRYS